MRAARLGLHLKATLDFIKDAPDKSDAPTTLQMLLVMCVRTCCICVM